MVLGTKKVFQRTTFAANAYQTNNRNVIPATFQTGVFQKTLRNFQEDVFDITGIFSGDAKSTFQAHEVSMVVFHDGVFDTDVFQSNFGKDWVQAISDAISSSEVISRSLGLMRAISETINSADYRGTGRAIARSISNAVNISLSSLRLRGRGAVVNDTIGITEVADRVKTILTRIISDSIGIVTTNNITRGLNKALQLTVNIADFRGTGRALLRSIAETVYAGVGMF